MARKRLLLLALPVAAALAVAGVAVADTVTSGAHAASATFSATTVSNARAKTCSVNGGDELAATVATYAGTVSSSDPRLAGNITIRAHSLVNMQTGLGRVSGVFDISSANGKTARGNLDAVLVNGAASGVAAGLVTDPGGRLVGTLSGSFGPASGFASGSQLGGSGNVSAGGAVLSGACQVWHPHSLHWLIHRLRQIIKHH